MGISIHFQGKASSSEARQAILAKTKDMAVKNSWRWETLDEAYGLSGISLFPHDFCEPLHVAFDDSGNMDDYVKTQFAPIAIHQSIIELMLAINQHMDFLEITDEGNFLIHRDPEQLQEMFNSCLQQLHDFLDMNINCHGPVKMENGRIIDAVSRDHSQM